MEKKMTQQKTNEFVFGPEEKKGFKERLRLVIGNRSVRAAAASWGLSYSTVNNYLTKTTEPSFFVMGLVARKENVSLEWLAYGNEESYKDHEGCVKESNSPVGDPLFAAWEMIYKSLSTNEVTALISLLMREGAKGVLTLAAKNDELDSQLLSLSQADKERLIATQQSYEEAKKGASQECEMNESGNLASDKRQAG